MSKSVQANSMIRTRPISGSDLELICRHREEMFKDAPEIGATDNTLGAMTANFRVWLAPRLQDASYFGFIAEEAGVPIGGIGLTILPWPPHPAHPTEDKRGYILNVYVAPSHRRRKVGELLMKLAEDELRRRGISFAVLHATAAGRHLYETLSWQPATEMFKNL